MSNYILGISSIFFGACHLYAIIFYYNSLHKMLYLYYIGGVITSIGNHFSEISVWKYGDRFIMTVGSLVNGYYIYEYCSYKLLPYCGIGLASISYFASKTIFYTLTLKVKKIIILIIKTTNSQTNKSKPTNKKNVRTQPKT